MQIFHHCIYLCYSTIMQIYTQRKVDVFLNQVIVALNLYNCQAHEIVP